MTWEEMSRLIDVLITKVNSYFDTKGERVSLIAPLLRSGGIIGSILAIKMRIVPILPVQFKNFYESSSVEKMFKIPDILIHVPTPMNILLCDGNTSSGSTAVKAAQAIKEKYPEAKVILATLTKVFGGPEKLEGMEDILYGTMTDERFRATEEEMRNYNLRKGVTIFPWEDADDELSDINGHQE